MDFPATIVAIVTKNPNLLIGGGTPMFIVEDDQSMQEQSLALESVLDASAHQIGEETMIIVARP